MPHWLVCYDIADPKRLRRVHRLCLKFGEPVQYSVFHCELEAAELARLQQLLAITISLREDSVRYLPLCGHDLARGSGDGLHTPLGHAPAAWIV